MKLNLQKLVLLPLLLIPVTALAMGQLYVYPQVSGGQYIDAEIQVDCTGCWWDETAYIKGTVTLRGADTKTIRVNQTMKVYSGEYNTGTVNLAVVDDPYLYNNAVLNITVSGANTDTVRVNKAISLR